MAMAALSGIFILSLPIPILVNGFAACYKNRLWTKEVDIIRKERLVRHNTLKSKRGIVCEEDGKVRISTNWLREKLSNCHCCWGKCVGHNENRNEKDKEQGVKLKLLGDESENKT